MIQDIVPAVAVVIFKKEDPSLVLIVTHGEEAGHPTNIDGVVSERIKTDIGESPQEAAVRGVWEETGLTINMEDLAQVGTVDRIRIERKGGKDLVGSCIGFLYKGIYEGVIRPGNRETTPKWEPVVDVLREGRWLVNGTRQVLNSALKERSIIRGEKER
jgi:hypothetical protein